MSSSLHHILRVHFHEDHLESRLQDVLLYCERTGCREVLLFTTSYDDAASFVSLEAISGYVDLLTPYVKRLRESGITVGVNVMQTLGHIYYPQAQQEEFPFQRRVYADGTISPAGACPLCPDLRDWVSSSYALYAGLLPGVLFVDDDFRTVMGGGVSCFCDRHLEKMSSLAGQKISREEAVEALGQDMPNLISDAYWEVTTMGYCEIAERIRTSVHAISPKSRLAVMTAKWPDGCVGMDWARILPALCGEYAPIVRPQMLFYSEGFALDMSAALTNPDSFRASLPHNVEFWPEIETYPFGEHSKSAQCTFVQVAATILQGFDHLALDIVDFLGSPFADYERTINLLERQQSFLDALHALVPERSLPFGVRTVVHPSRGVAQRMPEAMPRWTGWVPNLGIPVSQEESSPWIILSGLDAAVLSNEEVDALLKRGVVMDAAAAENLCQRGFSERLGIKIGETISVDDLGYEEFQHVANPIYAGRKHPLRVMVVAGDWKKIEDLTGRATAASLVKNYKKETIGPALLLVENAQNERFGIMAWSGKGAWYGVGARLLFENRMRAEQLRETLAWVARRPLPLAVVSDTPFIWPIFNRSSTGDRVVGLINLSTDTYEEVTLHMGDPISCVSQLENDGQTKEVAFEFCQESTRILRLPVQLAPMGVAVFLLK